MRTSRTVWGVAIAVGLVIGGAVEASAQVSVLGRYGQTLDALKIRRAPTSRSRTYYTTKPYEYLCVNWTDNPKWLKVLMSNGAQGYVESERIAVLPYEVTLDRRGTRAGSRGNAGGRELGTPSSRAGAAQWGLNFIGTPYKWGGNDIQNGIDCSAFVKKLYGEIGISLPRTASEQAKVGKRITRLEDLIPGDRLYFWENRRNKIGHTGIYLGNGYFVHSSSGRKGVATDYLTEKWRRILVDARR
ncbi:MAG: C40 family peptidase [Fimbriimonadaceae bacterium]|nr:C40 family peptidase [Fimbriimonadaceae bacterium]